MPSFGVVVPTKNSMRYLPDHVEGMRTWTDLVDEIVVVDSESTDGTIDYLRARLNHPRVRYTSHPPGLYQSWNYGISQVNSEYVFLATTGDLITRDGIQKLLRAGEDLDCDVVISKPTFRDTANRIATEITWPIDDIISTLSITSPTRLEKLETVIFAVAHATSSLLGSCASDIFRTNVLRRFPFPTEFGTAGDGVWALQHAAEISWGVLSERVSSFLLHPTNASPAEKLAYVQSWRPDQILGGSIQRWRSLGALSEQEGAAIHLEEMTATVASFLKAKSSFDRSRRGLMPWIMNPQAWRRRIERNRLADQLQRIKLKALRSCRQFQSSANAGDSLATRVR